MNDGARVHFAKRDENALGEFRTAQTGWFLNILFQKTQPLC